MNDLLIHSSKADHMDRLKELFEALDKHNLRSHPKSVNFKKKNYMGNTFEITIKQNHNEALGIQN